MDISGAGSTIDFLRTLNNGNIIYSTGISACMFTTYYSDIQIAAAKRINN
jgi:hypothetical protein